MTTTTSTAIRDALETTIVALNPGTPAFGNDKYRRAAIGYEWESRPEEDVDRRFSIGFINEGRPLIFGSTSEIDYEGEFTLTIGHKIVADENKALQRANTDVLQIRSALEKKTNFPSGVSLVRIKDIKAVRKKKFWITEMKFRTVHTRAAP